MSIPRTYFFVKSSKDSYVRVWIRDIQWVQSVRGGILICTLDKQYMVCTSLKRFLERITHPSILRAHRSYAVNIKNVTTFQNRTVYLEHKNQLEAIHCSEKYWDSLGPNLFILKSD